MKSRWSWLLALALILAASGCSVMLYPLARAFGGPAESDLVVYRRTFADLKKTAREKRLVVLPAWVVSGTAHDWDAEAARPALDRLHVDLSASAAPASVKPDLPFDPYHGNQMRHMWARARRYTDWVRRTRPEGDWFVMTEMWCDSSRTKLYGTFFYVVRADGQIAYARLYNSHSFGPNTVGTIFDAMAKGFVDALGKDPEYVFPPYGVG